MRAIVILAVLLAAPAMAASDAALEAGLVQARKACLKASNLQGAAIAGNPILFSDSKGKTVLLVTGRCGMASCGGGGVDDACGGAA
jgi:hypothetical protein